MVQCILFGIFVLAALVVLLVYVNIKSGYDVEDFKEESELVDEAAPQLLDDKTLEAQASLKGSVGGVQALLEIQASYAQGLTTYESAINMLDLIYGYNKDQAVRLLGKPKKEETL